MSSAALQPAIVNTVVGKKTERVLRVSPVEVTLELADSAVELCHGLAAQKFDQELEQRMRLAYRTNPVASQQIDPQAVNEDDFVRRHINDVQLRAVAQVPSYEKYTLLSGSSAVQFDDPNFDAKQLPKDLHTVLMRADGPNGRFIDIHLQTQFADFNAVRNWQLNQIIVHGEDPNWVNATYENLRNLIVPQTLRTRALVYGNCLTLFWTSVVLLLFSEYRVVRWLYPSFNLQAPLSGTGAIVMFSVLTASVLVFANTVIPIYTHWFPYFEIEGNLSRARIASRKIVTGIITALYTGATVNLVLTVFGPALKRLLH